MPFPWTSRPSTSVAMAAFAAATPEQLSEYEGFGPWLVDVGSPEQMPPHFRGWYPQLGGADFLLKVPINVERREALPGQVLYRAVLAVDSVGCTMLTWTGEKVVEQHCSLDDVVAIRTKTVLLLGELRLFLRDGGALTIEYNAVSRRRVLQLVDFLRARLPQPPVTVEVPAGPVEMERFPYGTILRDLRTREPGYRPLHADEPEARSWNPFARRQPGILILETEREAAFVVRGADDTDSNTVPYGYSCTHVPHSAIRSLTCTPPATDGRPGAGVLIVGTEGHDFTFDLRGDASAAARVLRARSGQGAAV